MIGTLAVALCGAAAVVIMAAMLGGDDGPAGPVARSDPLAGFHNPRTIHFAPDGRLLITDAGTGDDDGRVVAVDLEQRTQEVLWEGLPSRRDAAARFGDVSGPSAAAMALDGSLCVVIGRGPVKEGFSQLRCRDGLTVDLDAFERENDPGGGPIATDPFDIVYSPDGPGAWYVSDAGAETVMHISAKGEVTVVGVFNEIAFGSDEGVPTGLAAWSGRLTTALWGGAVMTGGENLTVPVFVDDGRPIAAAPPYQQNPPPGAGQHVVFLSYSATDGRENSGSIRMASATLVEGLDRPTGFVRLPDGRFVVAEQERSRVRIVEELK